MILGGFFNGESGCLGQLINTGSESLKRDRDVFLSVFKARTEQVSIWQHSTSGSDVSSFIHRACDRRVSAKSESLIITDWGLEVRGLNAVLPTGL